MITGWVPWIVITAVALGGYGLGIDQAERRCERDHQRPRPHSECDDPAKRLPAEVTP